MAREKWNDTAENVITHYLNLGNDGFDEHMKARYIDGDENTEHYTIEFETQRWQINERGDVHGGAIAGMFDTGLGTVANYVAGKNEAATVEMSVGYVRTVLLGQECQMKIYVVKQGARLIRLRGELFCKETGKLVATGTGIWIPL